MGTGCSRDACSVQYSHCDESGCKEAFEVVDEGLPDDIHDYFERGFARSHKVQPGGREDHSEDFEEELHHAKMSLRLASLLPGQSTSQPRPLQFFDEELVDGVHPARILTGEGAFPPGRAWCDVVLSESEVDMNVESMLLPPRGGSLDLLARSQKPTRVVLRCNGEEFASFTPGPSFKLFTFSCPSEVHVRSIEVVLEDCEASLQLGPSHGLRFAGKEVGLALSVHGRPVIEDVKDVEDLAAFTSALTLQAAQLGCLQPLPRGLSFRAEKAVCFVAFGCTGAEDIDVYLNGLTLPCVTGLRLGCGARERRMYRYVVVPVSCEIRSVVIRLHLRGRPGAGVIIDRSFGVRVVGHDALSSTVFVDAKTFVMTPHKEGMSSEETGSVQAGCWMWDGFYYMLAYRRTSKRHSSTEGSKALRSFPVIPED
eukprot:s4369_g5.t1